jgi:hypothetical protein
MRPSGPSIDVDLGLGHAVSSTAAPHATARPNARPAAKAGTCDPPFTIDAQGHKRYKRECLR